MEEVPGKRPGTLAYVHGGYAYNVDKRYPSTYRCASRRMYKCSGVLIKKPCGAIDLKTRHNHRPNMTMTEEIAMKERMRQMCRDTPLSPKDIFDAVSLENPDVAAKLSYVSIKTMLDKERARHRPALPRTMADLGNVLETYEPLRGIFKRCAEAEDGNTVIIFASDRLLEALKNSGEIYVDGTFSVVPRIPPMMQLYTIHIRYMDTGIATIFALCEARTTAVYCTLWSTVNELIPELFERVRYVVGDYERAAMSAARTYFPNARIQGCWFHYNQAILRKWKGLGLNNAPRTILKMAMTLPLAPAANFEAGLQIIQTEADDISEEFPEMLRFTFYLRRTWGPLSNKVSVHGCPLRTNNIVESFHAAARHKLGGPHPNLWQFLCNLRKLIIQQETNYRRLQGGIQVRRARLRENRQKDRQILTAQDDLLTGRLPLEQFLKSLNRHHESQIFELGEVQDENFNEDVIHDPAILDGEAADYAEFPGNRGQVLEPADIPGDVGPIVVPSDDRSNSSSEESVRPAELAGPVAARARPQDRGARGRGQIIIVSDDRSSSSDRSVSPANVRLAGRPPARAGRAGRQLARGVRAQGGPARRRGQGRGRAGRARGRYRPLLGDQHPAAELLHADDEHPDVNIDSSDDTYWSGALSSPGSVIDQAENPEAEPSSPVQAERPRGSCCVCLEQPAVYLYMPCKHLCTCIACELRLTGRPCSICRTPVDSVIMVIFV